MTKTLSSGRSGGSLLNPNRGSVRPPRRSIPVRKSRTINPPSNNITKTGSSKIQGNGVIATHYIPAGTNMGITHQLNNNKWKIASERGRYYNHSSNPNAVIIKYPTHKTMVIKDSVQSGEEITVDYTQQPDLEQPPQF